ncbi:MAG: RHS repeat-associated core domain-containing protein, partial [Fimbriimonas ginsengisoli]|nr:RHS repeat-associated core domain-containing protein [Fimbriimonas ginsengisoli]
KTDSAGTKTYKRDGAGVTDAVLGDGAASYTPGISERRSGASKFYHAERLGSNVMETDSSQSATATRSFDAFGLVLASSGSSSSPFGFVGQQGYQTDADSGLMLLGHRYYDPSTGRFLTRDKVRDGRNWFVYCDNRPTCRTDPDGLGPWIPSTLQLVFTFWARDMSGYRTLDDSVLAASRFMYPWSQGVLREFGGYIIQDGTYYTIYITAIGTRSHNDPGPPPSNWVGHWHSHPDFHIQVNPQLDIWTYPGPSPTDVDSARKYPEKRWFLMTSSGVFEYDGSGHTRPIGK